MRISLTLLRKRNVDHQKSFWLTEIQPWAKKIMFSITNSQQTKPQRSVMWKLFVSALRQSQSHKRCKILHSSVSAVVFSAPLSFLRHSFCPLHLSLLRSWTRTQIFYCVCPPNLKEKFISLAIKSYFKKSEGKKVSSHTDCLQVHSTKFGCFWMLVGSCVALNKNLT